MSSWCGYVRVSHVGERSGDSFRSPEDQTTSIQAWAKARGETVVMLPPELDASGGDSTRPILTEAVEAIEAGTYKGLVVAYLSRASRSVKHLLELWDRIETAGGQVVAVSENIDTSTPAGRLTRTMLAAIAEHELDLHRERFEDLRASATQRGIWQRRQTPRGYDRDPETRRLVPNEDAALVKAAFKQAAAGVPVVQIAEALGMSNQGARGLLRNRVYLGELKVGEHINPAAHPAILTDAEWRAAQTTRPATRSGSRYKHRALLAGLIRCEACGHVMARGTVKSRGRSYPSYSCSRQHSAGLCPAPASILGSVVHPIVEEIALRELADVAAEPVDDGSAVDEARAELVAAESELGAYVTAVSAADVGPEAFAEGAAVRRARVDEAQAVLARLQTSELANVARLVERWPSLDDEHRNQVLCGLLEAVVIRRGRISPAEKVRVFKHGAGILPAYRGGGEALPLTRLPFPDDADPRVLWL
jgi:DNA invertase Pin-like site-specific DNA recombinase